VPVDVHGLMQSGARCQRVITTKFDWFWFYLIWAGFIIVLPLIHLHHALRKIVLGRGKAADRDIAQCWISIRGDGRA